jgi:DMSO/TMAO reductase YedYZ molybdopterin-dependent catalytic subunit
MNVSQAREAEALPVQRHLGGLPPGQRAVEGFPRFGTHLHHAPPQIPDRPVIAFGGDVREPVEISVAELETLPRREVEADFHCVAGWSATGLRWEGMPFVTLYRTVIEPRLKADAVITYVEFVGLDGYRFVAVLDDVLADDVLLADRLDGRPLDADHGAPVRLVSPQQYGFVSTKHLCGIDVYVRRPVQKNPAAIRVGRLTLRTPLIEPHPRARVWREERHPRLPAWLLRGPYRLLIRPIAHLSARGARRADRRS